MSGVACLADILLVSTDEIAYYPFSSERFFSFQFPAVSFLFLFVSSLYNFAFPIFARHSFCSCLSAVPVVRERVTRWSFHRRVHVYQRYCGSTWRNECRRNRLQRGGVRRWVYDQWHGGRARIHLQLGAWNIGWHLGKKWNANEPSLPRKCAYYIIMCTLMYTAPCFVLFCFWTIMVFTVGVIETRRHWLRHRRHLCTKTGHQGCRILHCLERAHTLCL